MKLFSAASAPRDLDDVAPAIEAESHDDIFRLIPPRAESFDRPPSPERHLPGDPPLTTSTLTATRIEPSLRTAEVDPAARGLSSLDSGRLSLDQTGQLCWDGTPVAVRRRLSRSQLAGTLILGALLVVTAVGSALQGATAAHDMACRRGWVSGPCAPVLPGSSGRLDIPA